jgi:hypothetical protein
MAQVHKVRLPDGRIVRPTEWSSTPLYSTVEVAGNGAALTPLQGYSYGIGGEVPGSAAQRKATIQDTNMSGSGGILPENQELLLYALRIEVIQTQSDAADFFAGAGDSLAPPPFVDHRNMLRWQRDTILVMRIANTKRYADHPVAFFPGGMGVALVMGASRNRDAGEGYGVGYNGGVNCYDVMEFATPHNVKPGEAYEVSFDFPDGTITGLNFGNDGDARLRCRIYSDGYRMRPVA